MGNLSNELREAIEKGEVNRVYALVPDPPNWGGEWRGSWSHIMESICPVCKEQIGVERLALKTTSGWKHDKYDTDI